MSVRTLTQVVELEIELGKPFSDYYTQDDVKTVLINRKPTPGALSNICFVKNAKISQTKISQLFKQQQAPHCSWLNLLEGQSLGEYYEYSPPREDKKTRITSSGEEIVECLDVGFFMGFISSCFEIPPQEQKDLQKKIEYEKLTRMYLLKKENEVISGCSITYPQKDAGFIYNFCVAAQHRKKGHGKLFFAMLTKKINTTLYCRTTSEITAKVLQKNGFESRGKLYKKTLF